MISSNLNFYINLEYLLLRYAKDKEALGKLIKDNFERCREVEKKLFLKLPFNPHDLTDIIGFL